MIRERNLVKPTEQVDFQVTFVSICLKRPAFVADTPNMGSGRILTGNQSGYHAPWVAICTIPILAEALLLRGVGFSNATELGSPIALFIVILVAATLCVITSAFVLRRAFLTDTHELVPVGLFFMSVSILPLAHGLTTPGVLYGENTATLGTGLWAIPVGVALASPNLLPSGLRRRILPKIWKQWTAAGMLLLLSISAVSLAAPNFSPSFAPGGALEIAIAVFSIAGALALSYRQVRLAQIARNWAPLIIAAGYGFVAASAVMWFGVTPFSTGFWAAHFFDIGGVFAGTLGVLIVYRKADDIRDALGPALAADPLVALDLGLEPIVHTYIADLEAKDPITREHVVRTAELALRVGEELGYSGEALRHISLVGLLHDVGKLDIPDEILNKPDRLTDDEFDVVKCHPVNGANRALTSPILASLAPGIRGHHERVDGRGYPDQITGDAIPIESRIVAVCDAYDAMANTRQYREGMGREKAIAILQEHQGAQWDDKVVDALVRVVEHLPADQCGPTTLADVGRVGCDCLPAMDEPTPTALAA